MKNVLIVEDDTELAGLLAKALDEESFTCSIASNGHQGLAAAREHELLLVDVMMPVMNGFKMVEELRQLGHTQPVVFLTAKDATSDIVRGLESGGDDYLVKPFKLEELIARIRSALRRERLAAQVLEWQDVHLDCRRRTAFLGSKELFLSPTEFSLLELFVRRAGQVLPKSLILNEIWHADGFRDENIVELYVNYLRRKTELPGRERILHTVRRRGYVLATASMEP